MKRVARFSAFAFCLVFLVATAAQATAAAPPQESEHAVATQEPERVAAPQEPEPAATAQEPEHAAEEHASDEHGAAEHGGPSWLDYGFKWANFIMLVGILYWLLVAPPAFVVENFDFPGLRVVLGERARSIVQARDLAREQKVDAAGRLQQSEARLAQVESDSESLLAAAASDAERERQRIEARATEEATVIRDLAHRDMDSSLARARRDLQAHVADLAVGIAAKLVRENFSDQDQDRLVREYLDRLGDTVG